MIAGRLVRPRAGEGGHAQQLAIIESDNRRFAQNWRALFAPDAEGLRKTAQAAVEDWLEANGG